MANKFEELVTGDFMVNNTVNSQKSRRGLEGVKLIGLQFDPVNRRLPSVRLIDKRIIWSYREDPTEQEIDPPLIEIDDCFGNPLENRYCEKFAGLHGVYDIDTSEMTGVVLDTIVSEESGGNSFNTTLYKINPKNVVKPLSNTKTLYRIFN